MLLSLHLVAAPSDDVVTTPANKTSKNMVSGCGSTSCVGCVCVCVCVCVAEE